LCRRRALTLPERFATVEVGMRVAFEPQSGPTGLCTGKITVMPLKTSPIRSFQELAGYFHRHAAGSLHDPKHLTRRWLMHVPQWVKPAFWGVVVGALGIMMIGFSWWGWMLGSTAERMASERAGAAVSDVLVPICVAKFMGQADATAKLAEFQKGTSWQQSQVIEKGGWATATGSTSPNAAVARACAQHLAKINT
jgi:hypothetical protein